MSHVLYCVHVHAWMDVYGTVSLNSFLPYGLQNEKKKNIYTYIFIYIYTYTYFFEVTPTVGLGEIDNAPTLF